METKIEIGICLRYAGCSEMESPIECSFLQSNTGTIFEIKYNYNVYSIEEMHIIAVAYIEEMHTL